MITHTGRRAVAAAKATPPLTGFSLFKHAVSERWAAMSTSELFRTSADRDAMWTTYLSSFPEGSNPLFRKRTEHDCSCCRQFIRAVGNVVAIVDGNLVSIWDVDMLGAYGTVARALAELVRSTPIDNRFLHTESQVGTDRSFEDTVNGVKTWDHFHIRLSNSRVVKKKDIGPKLSESRAMHDVMLRSLSELTLDSADTVLELISQNSLYRGEEHRASVAAFRQAKTAFDALPEDQRDPFAWLKSIELAGSVAKIRNTSIGQLLIDLSSGEDLEGAVRKFEAMVAPANYRRPTALVTKAMIDHAKATVEELGLTSALERRYATLRDIPLGNVLWADRSAVKAVTGNVFDEITPASKPKSFDRIAEIGIDKFLTDVLPGATRVEALFENRHAGNLVSLIAPVDPGAGRLFKWDNGCSWSYSGDFADSVKERVKRAGGNVTGDLCCRLAWSNYDDLDFHMVEPSGYEIFYRTRRNVSPGGGLLDVDANGGIPQTREPVENIFYGSSARMYEGVYRLFVHQFSKRDSIDVGFEGEIDFKGTIHRFAYPKPVRPHEMIEVAQFRYSHANGLEILTSLPLSTVSKKVWGLDTETFHRVNAAMLSPNYWNGHGIGNKHYFFMLADCRNDGTARGFYNEFLAGELDPHRKVFEIVGSKMRTDEPPDQLSGLGFSSTQRNSVTLRVTGASSRMVRVVF